jgi:hypothetical protein
MTQQEAEKWRVIFPEWLLQDFHFASVDGLAELEEQLLEAVIV